MKRINWKAFKKPVKKDDLFDYKQRMEMWRLNMGIFMLGTGLVVGTVFSLLTIGPSVIPYLIIGTIIGLML